MKDNSQQHILITDYLRGIHFPNSKWEILYNTLLWFRENCSYTESNVFVNEGHPLSDLIKQDVSLRSFFVSYSLYEKSKRQNYVVGKNLAKALFHTKTDVSCSRLPKSFSGFIYLPGLKDDDGDEILGTFCDIQDNILKLGFISGSIKEVIPGFLFLPLEDDATVESILIKNAHHRATFDPNTKIAVYTKEKEAPKWNDLGVLLNAVIYITNSDEALTEEINQFSIKKNKYATEKKIYTSLPFIRVGFNFNLPKSFSVDSTMVRGHWRWQPCGPERAYIKHIYIEPHIRTYGELK